MQINKSITLLLVLFVGACANSNSEPCSDLLENIPPERVNSELQLSAPDNINDFSFDTPVAVRVDNTSRETMSISPDTDLKVYWLESGRWINIRNKVDYLSVTDLIPPKSDDAPGAIIYTVISDFPNQSESIKVCFVLEATIKDANGLSKIGAYTEITLSP